jgi:hypothetical protein
MKRQYVSNSDEDDVIKGNSWQDDVSSIVEWKSSSSFFKQLFMVSCVETLQEN